MEEVKMLSRSESDKEEKDIIMEEKAKEEKEMAEKEEQPKEEEKGMGCGKDMSDDSKEKEMEEKEEEPKEEEEEEEREKEFSLDAFLDQSFILGMLEKETEQERDFVDKIIISQ